MTLFDRYVVVDWSAASRPVTGPDSIWVAILDRDGPSELLNPSTRSGAATTLNELCGSPHRTLLAVDASLGYPAGAAAWFGLEERPPWRAMWRRIADHLTDGEDNHNNRFEVADALNRRGGPPGPFWGRPGSLDLAALAPTKPGAFPIAEFRRCEEALRGRGFRPSSGWQLLGAGSVGSQTLTILPVLDALLARGDVGVWPFTTGPSLRPPASGETIVAETWPTMFDVDVPVGTVRDAAQVVAVAAALRAADRRDELGRWFAIHLDGAQLAAVLDEEGWILAPTPTDARRARDCGAGG